MTINFFLFFPLFPFFVFSFLLSSYPPCYLLFILILRFCSSVFILFCLSCVCYLSFIDYPLLLHPICSFSFFIPFVHFPASSHLFIFLLHLIYYFLQIMAEKIRYAIQNCTEMDADYKMTESDISGWQLPIPHQAWTSYHNDD